MIRIKAPRLKCRERVGHDDDKRYQGDRGDFVEAAFGDRGNAPSPSHGAHRTVLVRVPTMVRNTSVWSFLLPPLVQDSELRFPVDLDGNGDP